MQYLTGKERDYMCDDINCKNKLNEQILNIENKVDFISNYISYARVPNYDKRPLPLYDYISAIQRVKYLHSLAFKDKRFKHYGKNIVITATGPSFEFYRPIKNAIHIGMNNAYKSKFISYDYLFCQDSYTCFGGKIPASFIKYRGKKCTKFFGNAQPLSLKINPKKYHIFNYMSENKYNYHIDIAPLPDFCSVVFSAFSFALWTTPKRIYLVGADCSSGHAKSLRAGHTGNATGLIKPWQNMASFAKKYYPDIEIISINPIGLKGLFKDVYTESFLKAHPEIDSSTVEILKNNNSIKFILIKIFVLLDRQRIRLLSHITKGKTKEHYVSRWKDMKHE